MTLPVWCFGAANIDRQARAHRSVRLGTSNPVTIRTSLGGVARNVAESLARLGLPVGLVSRMGSDPSAERILGAMARLGLDLSQVTRSATSGTASYTAVLEPGGEMTVAIADMGIYDEMVPAVLAPALAAAEAASAWFVDANLPAEGIAAILAHPGRPALVAVDAVSSPKSEKLRGLLDRIGLLCLNRDEAEAITGHPVTDETTAWAALRRLRAAGVARVVLNRGGDGALIADAAGEAAIPACPADLVDVTGAGDAAAAGTLYGLVTGLALPDAARLGRAAAALALEAPTAVPETLTADALRRRALLSA
jgi:pseudouridine kinase